MKIRFRNKSNGMLKGLDVSLSPIEGLIFHQAILRYASDPNENEIDRTEVQRMCDDFNAEIEKAANDTLAKIMRGEK